MSDPMRADTSPVPVPRCVATTRKGAHCTKAAIPGGTVCRFHGGAAPQVKAAAERRLAEVEVQRAVATFGERRDVSPAQMLLEDMQWTAGHVAWLRDQIALLNPEALTWGTTKKVDQQSGKGRKGVDTTEEARVNALVELYERERKHMAHLIEVALRANIAAHEQAEARRKGEEFNTVMRAVLGDLKLTADQKAIVDAVVLRRLGEVQ